MKDEPLRRRGRRVPERRVEALTKRIEDGDRVAARVGLAVQTRDERARDAFAARLRGDADGRDARGGNARAAEPPLEREKERVRDERARVRLGDPEIRELTEAAVLQVSAPRLGAARIRK